MPDINETIAERASRYGEYKEQAGIQRALCDIIASVPARYGHGAKGTAHNQIAQMPAYQTHALTMIAEKIARIMTGDPDYADNWHDIGGYAKLVEDRLPVPDNSVKGTKDNDTSEHHEYIAACGELYASNKSRAFSTEEFVQEGKIFYDDFVDIALNPLMEVSPEQAQHIKNDNLGVHKIYVKGLKFKYEQDFNKYEAWVLDHDREATVARNKVSHLEEDLRRARAQRDFAHNANDKAGELYRNERDMNIKLREELEIAHKQLDARSQATGSEAMQAVLTARQAAREERLAAITKRGKFHAATGRPRDLLDTHESQKAYDRGFDSIALED